MNLQRVILIRERSPDHFETVVVAGVCSGGHMLFGVEEELKYGVTSRHELVVQVHCTWRSARQFAGRLAEILDMRLHDNSTPDYRE